MLKANALFIVVVISLVIGILCSSLIMISYYQRLQVYKDQLNKRLDLNASSAINLLLAGADDLTFNENRMLDLYGDERDTVIIKKLSWGIFEIGAVTAYSSNIQKRRSILYGYKPDEIMNSAIYLADQNSQLALGGNTIIKGKCYLPESGTKRAYIEGQAFAGATLIQGEVKKSNSVLPVLDKKITDKLSQIFENRSFSDENIELFQGELRDTIVRSFNEKTLVIYNSNSLSLRGKNYQGNIMIFSDKLIEIDSSSKLSEVLVFAHGVKVQKYFKGNLQVFCTDSIVVEDNCNFLYPSALGVFKKDFNVMQPFVKVGEGVLFKGIIFSYRLVQDLQQTLISIGKNSEIEGQVYADGFVDLKGNVFGNVTCNKFTLRTPSSIYENHLLNVTIDITKLSPFFVGSSLITTNRKKEIIKWLE